ncbi:MAG: hypothetical protein RTU30_12545 [Candidatus Thorarchaeota archaeon]
MNKDIDTQIHSALEALTTMSREEGYHTQKIWFLKKHGERFVELYQENGTIASLTHRVLLNRGVAHFFCISLKMLKELWNTSEIQEAFAEALRQGDSLLPDAIMFIREYREIPLIQEALAYNISTCSSMLFQIMVVCSGLGLCYHPSIKEAILSRREDIIEETQENWHHGALVTYVPYLVNDEDVVKAIADAKPLIIEDILKSENLVDAIVLMKAYEWIRHDPDVVDAIHRRLLDNPDGMLLRTLAECNMYHRYPQLMDILNTFSEDYKKSILEAF